jgi:cytidine deaminase
MLNREQQRSLLVAAAEVAEHAHAPFSKYAVGAALLTPGGDMYAGCNVENASFGLTICAERAAVFSAIASGERQFAALALVTDDGAAPCGACRQVLAEFCDELPVYIASRGALDQPRLAMLSDLLPERFRPPSA